MISLSVARAAFAATTQAEGAPAEPLNLTVLTVGVVVGLIVAVVIGGALIAAIAAGVSRFLAQNMPSADVVAKLDKQQVASVSQPRKPITISPNWEPFAIALGGFVLVYVLAVVFIRPASESSAAAPANLSAAPTAEAATQNSAAGAASQPASGGTLTSLPTTGDFEKIVVQLPAGDADSGAKLFASIGCNACHSVQKDQRLVGPSFYGLWTRSANNSAGLSAKAYLYQSIVQPNAVIVEGYQPNLMPPNYATVLSVQQMADILAYIERDHAEE
ncbi:MAG: c-type cytochrome [Anaerolineae bacterium]|nr:c-type cytochrome [Thermoflexales bacterium]MDW8408558.1 c-type cytochrome [Anaerolineae bacterium]